MIAEGPTTQRVADRVGPGEGRPAVGTRRLRQGSPGDGPGTALRGQPAGLPVREATGVPWAWETGAVVGAHLHTPLPPGVVAATPGPVNAAKDELMITLRVRGGHSGYPHAVDDVDLAVRAGALLGSMGHRVDATFRSFGSDDFPYHCEAIRGLMLFVGTGAGRGGVHDPTFRPEDRYVATVAGALVAGCCAGLGGTT